MTDMDADRMNDMVVDKVTDMWWRWRSCLIMLTKADKGGGGVSQKLTFADRRGGVYEPPFLADVICEQPLIILI